MECTSNVLVKKHESIAPWTKEDDPENDVCLIVTSAETDATYHLWVQRALLNLCSPLLKSMDAEDHLIPIFGFEPHQVDRFLSVVHPGIFLRTTANLILEVAPVAHYLECSRLLEHFVSWLQEVAVFQDGAGGLITPDLLAAIVLLERLRPRTPSECPWNDAVLQRLLQQHVFGDAVNSLLKRTDMWAGIKVETQLKMLLVLRGAPPVASPLSPSPSRFSVLGWVQPVQDAGLRMANPLALYRASKDGWAGAWSLLI